MERVDMFRSASVMVLNLNKARKGFHAKIRPAQVQMDDIDSSASLDHDDVEDENEPDSARSVHRREYDHARRNSSSSSKQDRDQIVKELNTLAILLQKNGGVDVQDRKIGRGRKILRHSFACSDLVAYIQDTFSLDADLSRLVCYELWIRGLIYYDLNTKKHFADSDDLFFRVAHPYMINSCLIPSEIEKVYQDSIGVSGPRMGDHVAHGKMYNGVVSTKSLVDWLVHTKHYERKRAIYVAQQLILEGYYKIVGNAEMTKFVDSPDLYIQSRNNNVEKLYISNDLAYDIAGLLAIRTILVDNCNDSEEKLSEKSFPMEQFVLTLTSIVSDCSRRKALEVLRTLLKTGSMQMVCTTFHTTPRTNIDDGEICEFEIVDCEKRIDAALLELGSPSAKGGLGRADSTGHIFLRTGSALSANNNFGGSASSSTATGWTILQSKKRNSLLQLSKNRIGTTQSGSATNSGKIKSGKLQSFKHVSSSSKTQSGTTDLAIRFPVETIQVGRNLLRNANCPSSITVDKIPNIMEMQRSNVQFMKLLVYGDKENEETWSKIHKLIRRILSCLVCLVLWTVVFELGVALPHEIGAIRTVLENDEFRVMSSMNEFLAFAGDFSSFNWTANQFVAFVDPTITVAYSMERDCRASFQGIERFREMHHLERCVFNVAESTKDLQTETSFEHGEFYSFNDLPVLANKFQQGGNQTATTLVELFIIDAFFLGLRREPNVFLHLRLVGRIGPYRNKIFVQTIPLEDDSELSWKFWCLIILSTMNMIDIILTSILRRNGQSSLITVLRVIRPTLVFIGVSEHVMYVDLLGGFLMDPGQGIEVISKLRDLTAWSNPAKICLIFAMLLSTLTLPGNILGDRYNIFVVLKATFRNIGYEARVLSCTALVTLSGFSLAIFSLMHSRLTQYHTMFGALRTLLSGLFGGSPWIDFSNMESWDGYFAWFFTFTFLAFFIFILMNIFVATLLRSYTQNKEQEDAFADELKKHLHLSVGKSGISSVLKMLRNRLRQMKEADADFDNLVKEKGIIKAVHSKLMSGSFA